MTMTLALLPLALGLATSQALATPAPIAQPVPSGPVGIGQYRAVGTEPFWELTVEREMRFTDLGRNNSIVEPTPPMTSGVAGGSYQGRRISLNIVHATCSDGMSERSYPDTVQVSVDGRQYRGCGGTASPMVTVDDRGNPHIVSAQGGPVTAIERTRWRVTRINGRAVPRRGDYHVDFDSGRILAKFGCNAISGTYSQAGTTLDAGALIATRMACGNMALEMKGSAILDQLMTIRVMGRNRLALVSSAGSIDLVRR